MSALLGPRRTLAYWVAAVVLVGVLVVSSWVSFAALAIAHDAATGNCRAINEDRAALRDTIAFATRNADGPMPQVMDPELAKLLADGRIEARALRDHVHNKTRPRSCPG